MTKIINAFISYDGYEIQPDEQVYCVDKTTLLISTDVCDGVSMNTEYYIHFKSIQAAKEYTKNKRNPLNLTKKWESIFIQNGTERAVRDKDGLICSLPKPFHYPNQDARFEREMEECKANAKLISAAPDLLEISKECMMFIGLTQNSGWNDIMDKLKKAIKKATI